MNVITNMKGLIQQVEGIAMLVKDAAGGVEDVSARIEDSSQGIKMTLGILPLSSHVAQERDSPKRRLSFHFLQK